MIWVYEVSSVLSCNAATTSFNITKPAFNVMHSTVTYCKLDVVHVQFHVFKLSLNQLLPMKTQHIPYPVRMNKRIAGVWVNSEFCTVYLQRIVPQRCHLWAGIRWQVSKIPSPLSAQCMLRNPIWRMSLMAKLVIKQALIKNLMCYCAVAANAKKAVDGRNLDYANTCDCLSEQSETSCCGSFVLKLLYCS